jgi:NAD(P)-dependent dehydrogenase (short-subunit alcohol dehydrogenase family)
MLADNNETDLKAAAAECQQAWQGAGGQASAAIASKVTDVSVLADVTALKEAAYAKFQHVDFLMNNAATQNNGAASAIEHMDRWTDTLAVNLMGEGRAICCMFSFCSSYPQPTEPLLAYTAVDVLFLPRCRPRLPGVRSGDGRPGHERRDCQHGLEAGHHYATGGHCVQRQQVGGEDVD